MLDSVRRGGGGREGEEEKEKEIWGRGRGNQDHGVTHTTKEGDMCTERNM